MSNPEALSLCDVTVPRIVHPKARSAGAGAGGVGGGEGESGAVSVLEAGTGAEPGPVQKCVGSPCTCVGGVPQPPVNCVAHAAGSADAAHAHTVLGGSEGLRSNVFIPVHSTAAPPLVLHGTPAYCMWETALPAAGAHSECSDEVTVYFTSELRFTPGKIN